MRIAYTPEQERLRRELRGYFAALMTPEVRAALAEGRSGGDRRRRGLRGRAGLPPGGPATRPRRLAGARLAGRARRARRHHAGPAHLHRRGGDRAGAGAVPDRQHGGPDDHAVRHPGPAGVLPARGSPRARSTSRSATPSRRPAPTWPRCAPRRPGTATICDRRPEDVDQPDPVRRLRLAGLPDRPARRPAQGPVHHHRAHVRRGLFLDAGAHGRGRDDQRHVLLLGARACHRTGR